PNDLSAKFLNELDVCLGSPSRRKQVVDYEHFLSGPDRVLVDFKLIGAVFQFILDPDSLVRQLALLPYRRKALPHRVSQRCTKYEAPGFGSDDHIEITKFFRQPFHFRNTLFQCLGILQDGRDVDEIDALLRKIRHVPEFLLKIHSKLPPAHIFCACSPLKTRLMACNRVYKVDASRHTLSAPSACLTTRPPGPALSSVISPSSLNISSAFFSLKQFILM